MNLLSPLPQNASPATRKFRAIFDLCMKRENMSPEAAATAWKSAHRMKSGCTVESAARCYRSIVASLRPL